MKRFWLIIVLPVALLACSKDKFKSQPQVEITSFGPSEVYYGENIDLKATVRDKEGDLQDSLYVIRKRFNGTDLLTSDTVVYNISNFGFPNKQTIEIELQFSYGQTIDGKIYQAAEDAADRNFVVGLIIQDKAGNKSDYVETKPILLKKS